MLLNVIKVIKWAWYVYGNSSINLTISDIEPKVILLSLSEIEAIACYQWYVSHGKHATMLQDR